MELGQYIKELRISKGMSLDDLSKITGVLPDTVKKWESGQTKNLKKRTIHRLSVYFGVSFSRFFPDSEDKKQ